jgi:hypothetical protein
MGEMRKMGEIKKVFCVCPMPNAQCPIPNAQAPMPNPHYYFMSFVIILLSKLNLTDHSQI